MHDFKGINEKMLKANYYVHIFEKLKHIMGGRQVNIIGHVIKALKQN